MMKEKLTKVKEWTKDHKDELAAAGFVTGVFAFYAVVIGASVKAYNKQVEDYNQQQQNLNEAINRGASILPGPNGGFWILERDAS